jgi:hypothetical protein
MLQIGDTEREEILVYINTFYFKTFIVIWLVNAANAVILDVAARWKTTVNTEHLLKMASCQVKTRRDRIKK